MVEKPAPSDGNATIAEIRIRLQPRARNDEIVGEREGRIVVRVTAPPLEGRANDALRKLIAKQLRVAPSCVRVARGERSRDKVVTVEGVAAEVARRTLLSG